MASDNYFSKNQKLFWFGMLVLSFGAISCIIYFLWEHSSRLRKTCSSEECHEAARFILENMDETVDPCENFYSFACGNFVEKATSNVSNSVINDMDKTLRSSVKDILDHIEDDIGSHFGKLKIVYDSCVNKNSSDENAITVFMEYLERFGILGWPKLKIDFKFMKPQLPEVMAMMASYKSFAFINFEVPKGPMGSGLQNLSVNAPYSFYQPMIRETKASKLFDSTVLQVLNHIGEGNLEGKKILQDFSIINNALDRIQNETEECEEADDDSDCGTLGQHLNCYSSNVRNKLLCDTLYYFVQQNGIGHLYSTNYLSLENGNYVERLYNYISSISHRSLANYIATRLLLESTYTLDTPLRLMLRSLLKETAPYHAVESDFKVVEDQEEHCVRWMAHHTPYFLSKLYIRKKMATALGEIEHIFKFYIEKAGEYTENQKWLGDDLKHYLSYTIKEQINILKFYSDEMAKSSKIDSMFNEFKPSRRSFFENSMELSRISLKFILNDVKNLSDVEKYLYDYRPFIVNAAAGGKAIELKFGIVLPPIYHAGIPKLINMVTLGQILGHEIGHIFSGDMFGLFEAANMSDDQSIREIFINKTSCLEHQFSQYVVQSINKTVKGNFTLVENMCDLIAIQLVDKVITEYMKQNYKNTVTTLPELKYKSDQVLYISLAQMWCSAQTAEVDELNYKFNSHSPNDIRLTGMLRNSDSFAKAFGCSTANYMNPKEKCNFFE